MFVVGGRHWDEGGSTRRLCVGLRTTFVAQREMRGRFCWPGRRVCAGGKGPYAGCGTSQMRSARRGVAAESRRRYLPGGVGRRAAASVSAGRRAVTARALQLSHSYIGTEHICWADPRGRGVAAQVLKLNADLNRSRQQVISCSRASRARSQRAPARQPVRRRAAPRRRPWYSTSSGATSPGREVKLDGHRPGAESSRSWILSRRTQPGSSSADPATAGDHWKAWPGTSVGQRARDAEGQADLRPSTSRRWSPARATAAVTRSA